MRVRKLTTWLVLGIAVALAYAARRRRGVPPRRAVPAAGARGTPAEVDPTTLGRGDEVGELFVEAIAGWELDPEADLEVEVTEPSPGARAGARLDPNANADANPDASLGEPSRVDVYGDRRAARGGGDLYGVHVTPAVDRELPDDDQAQAEGESWLEHLGASAAELGPEPELVLDMGDDSDPHAGHHKTETSDTPVADHGSGGPRGL
jgi:hypothetical protein